MTLTPAFCDIDLERWKDEQYSDLITDSLWLFPKRDQSHGHSGGYHGNFVPQVINQVVRRYTKPGELVIDLFLGSGTTAIEACRLGRRVVGVDLRLDLVQAANERSQGPGVLALQHDSTDRRLPGRLRALFGELPEVNAGKASLAQLVILHPPYLDIVKFSDHERDMSNIQDEDGFLTRFNDVAMNAYELLDPGRFAVLVIGDKYDKGQLIPLGFKCMLSMTLAGFKLKAINVKDIQGNERGNGKDAGLWRYRALKSGFSVFKHEYVMIFQKGE
jgi:SAM-dependent methyltransferase